MFLGDVVTVGSLSLFVNVDGTSVSCPREWDAVYDLLGPTQTLLIARL